jgi:hypothetical protein
MGLEIRVIASSTQHVGLHLERLVLEDRGCRQRMVY